jgi:hypothetical protein
MPVSESPFFAPVSRFSYRYVTTKPCQIQGSHRDALEPIAIKIGTCRAKEVFGSPWPDLGLDEQLGTAVEPV